MKTKLHGLVGIINNESVQINFTALWQRYVFLTGQMNFTALTVSHYKWCCLNYTLLLLQELSTISAKNINNTVAKVSFNIMQCKIKLQSLMADLPFLKKKILQNTLYSHVARLWVVNNEGIQNMTSLNIVKSISYILLSWY